MLTREELKGVVVIEEFHIKDIVRVPGGILIQAKDGQRWNTFREKFEIDPLDAMPTDIKDATGDPSTGTGADVHKVGSRITRQRHNRGMPAAHWRFRWYNRSTVRRAGGRIFRTEPRRWVITTEAIAAGR